MAPDTSAALNALRQALELEKRGHQFYEQAAERTVDPAGSATWWITEYDPTDKIAFCYVTGLVQDEWGYTSLIELEGISRPFGLTIERDLYFVQKKFSEAVKTQ